MLSISNCDQMVISWGLDKRRGTDNIPVWDDVVPL